MVSARAGDERQPSGTSPRRIHRRPPLRCAMPDRSRELLQRYLPWRRLFEVGFWVLSFVSAAAVNSVIVLLDIDRVGLPFAAWEPVLWEWSSNLVLLALVPAVIAFRAAGARFNSGLLRRHLPWHVPASMVFLSGPRGRHGGHSRGPATRPWARTTISAPGLANFSTSTSRTAGPMRGSCVTVLLYRLLLLRLQGESRLLDSAR